MPSRRDLLVALSAAGFGGLAGCSGQRRIDGRWPRAGYDDRNSGHAPDVSGPGASPTTKWTARVPDGQFAPSPALDGDRVYLGYGADAYLDARQTVGLRVLDAVTGEVVRDVTVTSYDGDATADALYRDSVVFADGAVYLAAFDGLYSLTPGGEQRWHVDLGGGPTNSIQRSGHPVVADGVAYAPTASTTWDTDANEAVYAVDAASGDVDWRYDVSVDDYGWTFPPAYADGAVYVAALGYGVVALSADAGDVLWRTRLPGANGPPTLADGRVYASLDPDGDAETSHVVALDAATGEEVWRSTGGGSWVGRRIAAARGRVYVRENLNELVARDGATGDEVWRYAGAANVSPGTPAVTDEAIYVAVSTEGDDCGIAVIDPETGERSGFGDLDAAAVPRSSIAVSDGVAVVTSQSGRVTAVEACTLDVAGRCLY